MVWQKAFMNTCFTACEKRSLKTHKLDPSPPLPERCEERIWSLHRFAGQNACVGSSSSLATKQEELRKIRSDGVIQQQTPIFAPPQNHQTNRKQELPVPCSGDL